MKQADRMLDLSAGRPIGAGLCRPESVLATANGDLFCSHIGHGVARIRDGLVQALAPETIYRGQPLLPNGIALRADGTFVIANIADAGGIFQLDADGCRPLLTEMNGRPAPPVNFVTLDETGRVWFSVSSTQSPRHLAYRRDVADGFIGVIEAGRARIVLDGLHYTNEIRPDLEQGWLYISETMGRRISRCSIDMALNTGPREVLASFPRGAFVDGITQTADGGLVAACIVSNELFHIASDGAITLLASERDEDWVIEVETALDDKVMGRHHFDHTPARVLRNVSSVAFCGADLDTLVCGCLLGDRLIAFDTDLRGKAPLHWTVKVDF